MLRKCSEENIRAAALWLLVPSLSLISHTYAPLPPVLLFFAAGLILTLYGVERGVTDAAAGKAAAATLGATSTKASAADQTWHVKPKQRTFLILSTLFIAYLLASQCLMDTSLRSVWGVAGTVCYGLLPLWLWCGADGSGADGSGANTSSIITTHRSKFDWAFSIALVVYTLEALWRYGMAWFLGESSIYQGIYRYKIGGLMYSDSNVTGVHILVWLFFTLWWWRRFREKRYLFMAAWWLVLLGLTLSRAGYVAAVVGLLYFCWPVHQKIIEKKSASKKSAKKRLYPLIGLLVGLTALFVLAGFLYSHVQYDASFISKFQIFYAFSDYWQQASWVEKLFGTGLTRSETAMGIYAHSYGLVFLVETGMVGLVLMLSTFIVMLLDSRFEGLYLLLPFAVATLSEAVLFMPELFLFLSLMMAMKTTGQSNEAASL